MSTFLALEPLNRRRWPTQGLIILRDFVKL